MSGPWLTGMLSFCYSFWGMLLFPCIDPVSKSFLPSSTLTWSFFESLYSLWLLLARLSFSSALVFGHKDQGSQGNPGLPLPVLLAKKFRCCVSYCLVKVGDHGVQISIFISQRSKRCKCTSCLESTYYCWILQLLEVKPDSWLGWISWILKACLESHHHHVMVDSNVGTWECSCSDSFNTWTEPFLHQDVVILVVMCSIWVVPCPPAGWLMGA